MGIFIKDRHIFSSLYGKLGWKDAKSHPDHYYQFILTKSYLKPNTFLLKLVTVLGRTTQCFYCNCLLFLQQSPRALYIHYNFKHADISIAPLQMVMSLQELKGQHKAPWLLKSYMEATWNTPGSKWSFSNKLHFSKILVLTGGLE